MKTLFCGTTAYRLFAASAARGETAHTTLVLFPDAKYLRALLKMWAAALFQGERAASLIEREMFSDCKIYPAAGEKYTVDVAAEIIGESELRPVEGEKKVFVLDAFSTASPLVQNKLLKVLEEPPAGVYFLLGATAEHAILPTVLSRAEKHALAPFSEKEIEDALRRTHAREQGIHEAAAASGGIFSAAEDLLAGGGEDFVLAEKFFAGEDIETLCASLAERKEKGVFFSALKLVARDLMLIASGQGVYAARKTPRMLSLARRDPAGVYLAAVGFIGEAERDIQFNTNPRMAALALYARIQKEREAWQKLS